MKPKSPPTRGATHKKLGDKAKWQCWLSAKLVCDALDDASPDAERLGDREVHGFPITAVECKRNLQPLAVVAADLKAVGTPTPITFIHCNAAVMAPLVPANVAIEQ